MGVGGDDVDAGGEVVRHEVFQPGVGDGAGEREVLAVAAVADEAFQFTCAGKECQTKRQRQ